MDIFSSGIKSSMNFNIRIDLCNHNQDTEQFYHPQTPPFIVTLPPLRMNCSPSLQMSFQECQAQNAIS